MITREHKMISRWKHINIGLMIIGILCLAYPMCSRADQTGFNNRVTELKAKFPHGKYWNHVGMTTDNSDGYTDSPCTLHKADGVSHVYGTGGCTCNHFADGGHVSATQCMGFANKLGHDVFGDTTWTMCNAPTAEQIANIQIGDIVRIDGYHSVFVIGRNGNVIIVGEANYPNGCQISWDRQIDLTTVTVSYYEHANNYDAVMSGTQNSTEQGNTGGATTEMPTTETPATNPEQGTTETPTTETGAPDDGKAEESYTGWKLAGDGENYEYYKNGELQTEKWLKIDNKKYYVDEDGYRVTGFYDINQYTYYFNSDGVLQKNKWFKIDGETYYVNEDGIVLKSQWLWYKSYMVYVTKDGSIAKSELVKIGSDTYYFNSKGKRSKGFKKCNGKYYYCNSKGIIQKKKWITKNGKKYYLQKNGVRAQSKLVKIGKYRYYFNNKGYMVKNKRITYNGKIYKADKKGRCRYIEDADTVE